MTALIVGASLMLSLFAVDSGWFDTSPQYYSHTYETKEHCQEVRKLIKDRGTVCTDKHALYITK